MKTTEKLPPETKLDLFVSSLFMAIIERSPWRRPTARFLVALSDVYLYVRYGVFWLYYRSEQLCRIIRRRVSWRYHCWVYWPWCGFQQRVVQLYYRRVKVPVWAWVRQGCPPESMPRLPWWHRLLWCYIMLTYAYGRSHPVYFRFRRRRHRS